MRGAWRATLTSLLLGGALHAHGTLEERLVEANREQQAYPEHALSWLRRAALHREGGDLQAALSDLDEAEGLDPGRASARTLRAEILVELGRSDDAKALLDELIVARPCYVPAQELRGQVAQNERHFLRAARAFERAIACSPSPRPDHHLEHARALAAAGGRHRSVAIAALETAIERLGPVPSLERELISLDIDTGRHSSALGRIDSAIARHPESPWWLERRADLLRMTGRLPEARADYVRARLLLQRRPRAGNAYQTLAKRLETAITLLNPEQQTGAN